MIKCMVTIYLLACFLGVTQFSQAAPYKPKSNELVLAVVGQYEDVKNLANLTKLLKQQPGNINLLDKILSGYIKLGRSLADERYFAYAEALLKSYLNTNARDKVLLVHWAEILQRRHDFQKSHEVLTTVLKYNPGHARARLMRVIIMQAKGNYSAAMKDCRALLGRSDLLVVTTCIAQIRSLTGQLASSQSLLARTLDRYPGIAREERSWAVTILAEMYIRSGELKEAEKWILSGLKSDSDDFYLLALYADLMMQTSRHAMVSGLLNDFKHVDKLLLRIVIAEVVLNKKGSSNMRDFDVRIDRARQFKNASHLRLLARYYLDVKQDVARALEYARKNWEDQREPDDILILARCLHAADDMSGLAELKTWLDHSKLEDKRLDDMLADKGFI